MSDIIGKQAAEPMVSVYCMTYNHKNTIAQTIEGIVNQKTSFPFELIIHDDASTDGTTDIVKEYEKKYPDIIKTVIQTENQYYKCNIFKTFFNPIAKGKYVAVCEGDDYWTDMEKLQRQVDAMEYDPQCTMCFHTTEQLFSNGDVMNIRRFKRDVYVDSHTVVKYSGAFCPTPSIMLRADVMKCWPKFRDTANIYDYPFQALAASMGTVKYIDRSMAVYRYASEGSWTALHEFDVDYAHIENEIEWLWEFDEYTSHRFKKDIEFHIAHFWFTEYRKNLDKTAKQKAKEAIKLLPFKNKVIFGGAILVFSTFGLKANKWWLKLKKMIFK